MRQNSHTVLVQLRISITVITHLLLFFFFLRTLTYFMLRDTLFLRAKSLDFLPFFITLDNRNASCNILSTPFFKQ